MRGKRRRIHFFPQQNASMKIHYCVCVCVCVCVCARALPWRKQNSIELTRSPQYVRRQSIYQYEEEVRFLPACIIWEQRGRFFDLFMKSDSVAVEEGRKIFNGVLSALTLQKECLALQSVSAVQVFFRENLTQLIGATFWQRCWKECTMYYVCTRTGTPSVLLHFCSTIPPIKSLICLQNGWPV